MAAFLAAVSALGCDEKSEAPAPTSGAQWCDVKAVLATNCVACHSNPPAGGAPFPLETYADLTADHPSKAGLKVYERVAVRVHEDKSSAEGLGVMPPARPISAESAATIDAWVAAGAPAGNDLTCASTPTSTNQADLTWPLPECDAVYTITAHGATVDDPAVAPAGMESHPKVMLDAPWGDEEVQAIGFRSITDNKKVLHHWILNAASGAFLTGWAPGEDGVKQMRADVGMEMPTGKNSMYLDMHYFNTTGTTDELDASGVEVCVISKDHFREHSAGVTQALAGLPLIPANSTNYAITGTCTVSGSEPVTLLTASPHAHTLARRMIFTLQKKDGPLITMHDMPFMFGEQRTYPLDPPIVVENGDVITTTCMYDNPGNQLVTFSESTTGEMCFNFASYYPNGALTCTGSLFGALTGFGGFGGN